MNRYAALVAVELLLGSCAPVPVEPVERNDNKGPTDTRHDFGNCASDDSRGDRYDCHQDRHS